MKEENEAMEEQTAEDRDAAWMQWLHDEIAPFCQAVQLEISMLDSDLETDSKHRKRFDRIAELMTELTQRIRKAAQKR